MIRFRQKGDFSNLNRFFERAKNVIKIGELERAIESFEKVIAFNKNYVGTYYHLAQTFEKQNKLDQAIAIYNDGIQIASLVKDQHAKNELQMALDELID